MQKTAEAATTETLYQNLVPRDEINARSTNRLAGIDELAALIKSKGLIQPIVVRDGGKGKFHITAGNRRHAAIGKLIDAGDWPADKPVPIVVRDESINEAKETSLVENMSRVAMHPVDEFEKFAEVFAKEKDLGKIADRYGVTVRVVQQRLALGRLAPEIREAWRAGEIRQDSAMAFAICPDPDRQAAAFKALKKTHSLHAYAVTHHFKKDRPLINSERVAFVGLDAYKAAGGTAVESLFGEGYIENVKLLDKLVEEKRQSICDRLTADGWSWVEIENPNSWAHHGWASLTAKRKYTADEKARKSALESERKELQAKIEALPEEDDAPEIAVRMDAITSELETIDQTATERGFTPEQKKKAGCLVGQWGRITYGKVRNVSQAKLDKKKAKEKAANDGAPLEPEEPKISEALRTDITALQSEAVAFALAAAPEVAVRAVAAVLAMDQKDYGVGKSPIRLKPDGMSRHGFRPVREEDFDEEDDEESEDDTDASGTKSSGFASAFADIAPGTAANVLASAIAKAVDVRQIKYQPVAQQDIDALIGALPSDAYTAKMLELFDAGDYFARANGRIAAAALEDMGCTEKPPKGKAELAKFAADKAFEHRWLPAELRHPNPQPADAVKKSKARKAA